MTSTRIVLCTMGTRGDIAPFTALAAELVARGARVTLLANDNWRALAQACGAQFASIAPPDPTQSGRDDFAFFVDNVLPSFRRSFDAIAELRAAGERLVVVHKMGMLGAQCAAEKFGLPSVKVALQPSAIRSARRPAWPLTVLARGRWRAVTRPLIPAFYLLRELTGRYRPHTNRFRRSVGLRAVPLGTVNRTEDLTLVMCPPWFAMPQPDWPRGCHCVGFPFPAADALDDDTARFVTRHGAPLVFTPGTGVADAAAFFGTAREVCDSLELPAVFLSPRAGETDGSRVLTRSFVDLGALLPRARLLFHHGGIGTTAQALRAGIPQVILPNRFDQPDNAMRIASLRLGAVALAPRPARPDWEQLIRLALTDASLRARLAIASRDVRDTNAAARAATLIQKLSHERFGAERGGLAA
jgi:rhamnosyltransferase subunit B